ncbi:MAG TPA: phasin family protein [Burkholderiales bacterium]|jgi:phasin family protein|nr:phasin family protein [Burkholderiales bacterium]
MLQLNEQVTALGKSQLENALKLAEISVQGFDKLAALQLNTVKSAFADGLKTTKQFSSIKDASELSSIATTLSQPVWEKAQAYARGVYEVAATTQAEVSALLEQQVGELNKSVVATLDTVLKNAPAGSEAAVTAVKSAIQSANAAYESVLKATKQVAAITESNVANIAAQTAPTRKKAS